jgi:hypothetical protein
MQTLARTSTLGTVYSAAQVSAMLTDSGLQETWRFYLVDIQGKPIADITSYVDRGQPPSIEHDSTRAIQRTLTILVRKDAGINTLRALIEPHYQIVSPDGGLIDFTLGVFAIAKTEPAVTPPVTWLKITAGDLGQVLSEVKFLTAIGLPAGANVVSGILYLLGGLIGTGNVTFIPDRGYTLPTALGWKAGDTILGAITDLLRAMTYTDPSFDENGVLRADAIPDYSVALPAFTFDTTTGLSIVAGDIKGDVLDITDAPNIIRVDVEDPQRPAFSTTYTNNTPASAISVPNSFPRIMVIKDSTQVNGTTAASLAFTQAQQAAQVYATCVLDTYPWPLSQNLDVYSIVFTNPDEGTVVRKYLETGWRMLCAPGALTQHTWRRVVPA